MIDEQLLLLFELRRIFWRGTTFPPCLRDGDFLAGNQFSRLFYEMATTLDSSARMKVLAASVRPGATPPLELR
jgi:hypothetical protein